VSKSPWFQSGHEEDLENTQAGDSPNAELQSGCLLALHFASVSRDNLLNEQDRAVVRSKDCLEAIANFIRPKRGTLPNVIVG
jgi:hypothetical protein